MWGSSGAYLTTEKGALLSPFLLRVYCD
jgi:hypothetical protein